jgi:hypothetical protein
MTALHGLATPAPAATAAPFNTPASVVTVALISACAVIVAALVGAVAAIVAQRVSQGETTRRETAARRLREERVRKLFAVRARSLVAVSKGLASLAVDGLTIGDVDRWVRYAQEAFEPLALEFATFDLMLALEAKAIDAFGREIFVIRGLIRVGQKGLDDVRSDDMPFNTAVS